MQDNSFQINYPSTNEGANKTQITFFEGTPDLSFLLNEENSTQRHFFITDATVASLPCMASFISKFDDGVYCNDRLLILGSGEHYKTIETVLEIISEATKSNFTRTDLFIGIGGGVICDLTAFAASIYKRGIEVQLIPTTLLAMVDASIGGKTGCDFLNYKNVIGTFYPASKLYYFPQFIQTLPENQYNSGLAEAFKTSLLCNKELYNLFKTQSELIIKRDMPTLESIIKECVKAKSNIVEKDFTEKNIRTTLNLGHTFGHAYETDVGLGAVTHGSAVAWGIGRCIELAFKKDLCRESFKNEVFDILKLYGWETDSIPVIVKGGGIGERFIKIMHKDKKNLNDNIRLVLLTNVCETKVLECTDSEIFTVLK